MKIKPIYPRKRIPIAWECGKCGYQYKNKNEAIECCHSFKFGYNRSLKVDTMAER